MDTLFFIASKLVGAALKVEAWLLILALIAFWAAGRERVRLVKWASGTLLGMILVIGFLPLGDLLLRPIERTFPVVDGLGMVDGIIVLGGGEDVQASVASGQPQLGEGGDRYTATLALASQHPEARIVFAGGSGRLRDVSGAQVSEATIAQQIFLEQGVSQERLLFEDRSRNTAENAQLAHALAKPTPGETWVLVTSAFHMPRAMRSFQAAGWQGLVPYPVDFRTVSFGDGMGWDFARNVELVNTGLKEWVGRGIYAMAGL